MLIATTAGLLGVAAGFKIRYMKWQVEADKLLGKMKTSSTMFRETIDFVAEHVEELQDETVLAQLIEKLEFIEIANQEMY